MEHSHARAALPQWFSDQFGWQEIVEETAIAWNRLSPDERKDCGIFAQDYGTGRSHRLSRPPRGLAGFAQRPSDLVSLGTARLLGQLHDRAG